MYKSLRSRVTSVPQQSLIESCTYVQQLRANTWCATHDNTLRTVCHAHVVISLLELLNFLHSVPEQEIQ